MNDAPSSIKEFKSLNYEGTVSRLYNKTAGSESNLETNKIQVDLLSFKYQFK